MDVLTILLACSVYPDDALVKAMVDLASRGNPNFVGDISTLATFDKTGSSADADKLAVELERQGGRPVVGLMGVPLGWAQRYGRARSELYDACVNMWIGTAVLASHHEACVASHAAMMVPATGKKGAAERRQRIAPPEAIRLCALRRFGADLGVDGYAEAINRLLPRQRLLFTPAVLEQPPPLRERPMPEPASNQCHCPDPPACADPLMPPPRAYRVKRLPPGPAPILD